MSSSRGQATLEYVGMILLVAVVIAAAAATVAEPGLARAVVAKLRLGLCIVGADVCTTADAERLGLEPCLVKAEDHESVNGISIVSFRLGGTERWSLERRSDGSIVLGRAKGTDGQATAGLGFSAFGVDVGGSASSGGTFTTGQSWRLTEQRLREVMAITNGKPGAWRFLFDEMLGDPDEDYIEGGGTGGVQLAAEAIREVPGAGADAQAVLGRRRTRDGTTYYVRLGAGVTGPITEAVPGLNASGDVTAEYRASDPPVLSLRAAGRDDRGDETQIVLRLPLRDAADRAAARRVAFLDLDDPAPAVRDLVARVRARGTIERLRYRTAEDGDGWAYAAKLGLELGIDRAEAVRRRELVDATVLSGGLTARREDCLGAAA